jgi:hypothetical protein
MDMTTEPGDGSPENRDGEKVSPRRFGAKPLLAPILFALAFVLLPSVFALLFPVMCFLSPALTPILASAAILAINGHVRWLIVGIQRNHRGEFRLS